MSIICYSLNKFLIVFLSDSLRSSVNQRVPHWVSWILCELVNKSADSSVTHYVPQWVPLWVSLWVSQWVPQWLTGFLTAFLSDSLVLQWVPQWLIEFFSDSGVSSVRPSMTRWVPQWLGSFVGFSLTHWFLGRFLRDSEGSSVTFINENLHINTDVWNSRLKWYLLLIIITLGVHV